jgi:hypothetical protein
MLKKLFARAFPPESAALKKPSLKEMFLRRSAETTSARNNAETYLVATSDPKSVLVFPVKFAQRIAVGKTKEIDLASHMKRAGLMQGVALAIKSAESQSTMLIGTHQKPDKNILFFAGPFAVTLDDKHAESETVTYAVQVGSDRYFSWVSQAGRRLSEEYTSTASYEHTVEMLNQWHGTFQNASIKFAGAYDVSDFPPQCIVIPLDLEKFDPHQRVVAATKLSPQQTNYIRHAVIATLVLASLGTAYVFAKKEIDRRNLLASAAQIRAKQLAAYQAGIETSIKQNWLGTSALQYEQIVKPALKAVPVPIEGWTLINLACNFKAQTCDMEWKRGLGNYAKLVESLANMQVTITEDFQTVKATFAVSTESARTSSPFPSNGLPQIAQNTSSLGDLFALLNLADVLVAKPAIPAPLATFTGTGSAPPSPMRGVWKINSTSVDKINALSALPHNTTIHLISITMADGKPNQFTAEGDFYVKQ